MARLSPCSDPLYSPLGLDMADTLVPVQPNAESFVYGQLKAAIPTGVTSFVYALVTDDPPYWQLRYGFEVQAWGATRGEAWSRAERARQVMCSIPDAHWPDGVVTFVQPTDGPSWLPDAAGRPRYWAHYEVRVHPRQFVPAPGLT